MNRNYALLTVLILILAAFSFAQRPGGGGPPGGGERPVGPPGQGGPPRPDMQRPGQGPGPQDWVKGVDKDRNGSIDNTEFDAALEATFAEFDRNHDGVISPQELGPPKGQGNRPPSDIGVDINRGGQLVGNRPEGPKPGILPPFFFKDRTTDGQSLSKAQFEQMVRGVFTEMDKNSDRALSREEFKPPPRAGGPGQPGRPEQGPMGPPQPPNAQFIGAELRFGDKLVKGQPFSADIVIEDNRRLYDGSTVTKQVNGAVYRDTAGRTRREMPLENVGGFNVVGDNSKPQKLVFINDLSAHTQYFLDYGNKVARKNEMVGNPGQKPDKDGPPDAKSESLGTKTIDGISVEGTRNTFEIPAGQLGNAKPIQVIDERWFSPELQVVVLSRHVDPVAGEHVFKLVNIKRSEPSADLFNVPEGFKVVENKPVRRPEE